MNKLIIQTKIKKYERRTKQRTEQQFRNCRLCCEIIHIHPWYAWIDNSIRNNDVGKYSYIVTRKSFAKVKGVYVNIQWPLAQFNQSSMNWQFLVLNLNACRKSPNDARPKFMLRNNELTGKIKRFLLGNTGLSFHWHLANVSSCLMTTLNC
jgi:hypothetical protein